MLGPPPPSSAERLHTFAPGRPAGPHAHHQCPAAARGQAQRHHRGKAGAAARTAPRRFLLSRPECRAPPSGSARTPESPGPLGSLSREERDLPGEGCRWPASVAPRERGRRWGRWAALRSSWRSAASAATPRPRPGPARPSEGGALSEAAG